MRAQFTRGQRALLDGKHGPGARQAMEILAVLAELADAERFVAVESAQVAGVSYANIREPGLLFLEEWAAAGARASVPAYMNPCGMDTRRWRELGISDKFAEKQNRIIAALSRMGIRATLTCTPYEAMPPPSPGTHLAWSESSAVSCGNSLFAARTNREGGPSALAAAICGITPLSGLHLDEKRAPTHRIDVRCPLEGESDFGALGIFVGRRVGDGVPYFTGLAGGSLPRRSCLKALAAAMAASGAVALFHIEGVTPEAETHAEAAARLASITINDLAPAYARLCGTPGPVDLVAIGCPHASLDELSAVAVLVRGQVLKTRLWITTSQVIARRARDAGIALIIENAGGAVLSDMCLVVAPVGELGISRVVVNSAKSAYYLRSKPNLDVGFGSLEQCIDAALSGVWEPPAPLLSDTTGSAPDLAGGRDDVATSLKGRVVVAGNVRGRVLFSPEPIGFYGHVDPDTGTVTEPGHPLEGKSVAGRVLAFPRGKGSTVGSYVLYALAHNGQAPLALLTENMEPIVAAGAVIAGIPAVDRVDIDALRGNPEVALSDGEVSLV